MGTDSETWPALLRPKRLGIACAAVLILFAAALVASS